MSNRLCRICLRVPDTSKKTTTIKEKCGKWTLGYMFFAVTTYKIEGKNKPMRTHKRGKRKYLCYGQLEKLITHHNR